ncbi:MAG: hypothetical protein R3B96_21190 [Pirellulaceae bacterium]
MSRGRAAGSLDDEERIADGVLEALDRVVRGEATWMTRVWLAGCSSTS